MSMRMFKENGEYDADYVQHLELTIEELKKDVQFLHRLVLEMRHEIKLVEEETDE